MRVIKFDKSWPYSITGNDNQRAQPGDQLELADHLADAALAAGAGVEVKVLPSATQDTKPASEPQGAGNGQDAGDDQDANDGTVDPEHQSGDNGATVPPAVAKRTRNRKAK